MKLKLKKSKLKLLDSKPSLALENTPQVAGGYKNLKTLGPLSECRCPTGWLCP
ncbi:hypothetical protein PCIT_a4327 [Pseudoalteromonas citrea]|uniref:Uncharacterized protein n=1 Tax=Pseudoalteromonas citrea TaxID=43655 RepID=A0AAD4AIM7_9GAMM|nr:MULTISPECIES: hypothetical protein [Pseudoalteromonas]KAF7771258.1 hypothetical protein PCIT_a4327 [Pseudoalteromonas citrea]